MIDATTSGPAVRLTWDSDIALHTTGRDEIDFTLRYRVTAQPGYVALAGLRLVEVQLLGAPFPDSAPALFVEQFVSAAGTIFGGLVVLDVVRSQPADVRIIDPETSVDVSVHFVLRGEQNDDNINLYDQVRIRTFEQTFWRAERILTVNSATDAPDGNIGDGIADTGTSTQPTGITTLRAALNEADAAHDLDIIHFNLPAGSPALQPNS